MFTELLKGTQLRARPSDGAQPSLGGLKVDHRRLVGEAARVGVHLDKVGVVLVGLVRDTSVEGTSVEVGAVGASCSTNLPRGRCSPTRPSPAMRVRVENERETRATLCELQEHLLSRRGEARALRLARQVPISGMRRSAARRVREFTSPQLLRTIQYGVLASEL